MFTSSPIPYQAVDLPLLRRKNISLVVKRLDKIHPEIQGNKWYKLKYNIEEAVKQRHRQVLTFGGAYSNHIHATAAAARHMGLDAIGVIRGEEIMPLNPTLSDAQAAGMKLHYLSRTAYRNKNSSEIINALKAMFGDFFLIPEGGTNALAIQGTKEILEEQDTNFDFICTSVGTGGTVAGLLATANSSQSVLGFSSLKGDFIQLDIEALLDEFNISPICQHEIITNYHFGGYGKHKPELIEFIHTFKRDTGIHLDPIYTGKMMFGLLDLVDKGKIPGGSQVLALHSGGLQGVRGFNLQHGTSLDPGDG